MEEVVGEEKRGARKEDTAKAEKMGGGELRADL